RSWRDSVVSGLEVYAIDVDEAGIGLARGQGRLRGRRRGRADGAAGVRRRRVALLRPVAAGGAFEIVEGQKLVGGPPVMLIRPPARRRLVVRERLFAGNAQRMPDGGGRRSDGNGRHALAGLTQSEGLGIEPARALDRAGIVDLPSGADEIGDAAEKERAR